MKTKVKWSWIFVSISITLIGMTKLLLAEVELCSLEKMANVEPGYECQAGDLHGNAIWQLQVKTARGKKVWKNLTTGLLVSDILDEKFTQYQAEDICTNPSSLEARGNLSMINWSLPTGYPPKSSNEKNSDFETLEANGVRKVIDTNGRYFWSSSVDPNYSYDAFGFDGNNGHIEVSNRSRGNGFVLCVGR